MGSDFIGVFGSVPPGEGAIERVAVSAAKHGFAPLPIKPHQKEPICPLTSRDQNAADTAAQAEAKAAGSPNWMKVRHRCGLAHATTDPVEVRRWFSRKWFKSLASADPGLNLAIEVGKSRMILVDADSADEVRAFLSDWAEATGDDRYREWTPTVLTPGQQNADGSWAHSDAGHWWFYLPEGFELPTGSSAPLSDRGYAVYYRDRYALVPPSVRAEGAYRPVSDVSDAPQWLLDRITAHIKGHTERVRRQVTAARDGSDPIDQWSVGFTWNIVLEPDGWEATGRYDRCGCEIWTGPGEHAHWKSATAHEVGCPRWNTETGHGPLHVWTDNPPEFLLSFGKTVTRLQYVAARDFGGDQAAAVSTLGLHLPSTFPAPFEPEDGEDGSGQGELFSREPAALATVDTRPSSSLVETTNRETPMQLPGIHLPDTFWESHETLKHIRKAAYARGASPEATLGGVLIRVTTYSSHRLRTPEVGIDKPTSLTLFVGALGRAGDGKSISWNCAVDLVPEPFSLNGSRPAETWPLGSGEGIAESFIDEIEEEQADGDGKLKKRRERQQVRHAVMFTMDEGSVLEDFKQRNGSTTNAVLRMAWKGEPLGQANASKDRRRRVVDYVTGLYAGFQPIALAQVLADQELGTPQRFLWLTTNITNVPDEGGEWPGPLQWMPPELPASLNGGPCPLTIDTKIAEEIRQHNVGYRKGRFDLDPLDRHGMLVRLKAASALVLLFGDSRHVGEREWQLAGEIWSASRAARQDGKRLANQQREMTEEERLERVESGAEAAEAARKATEARIEKLVDWVIQQISKRPGLTHSQLEHQRGINRGRKLVKHAAGRARERGKITWSDGRWWPKNLGT